MADTDSREYSAKVREALEPAAASGNLPVITTLIKEWKARQLESSPRDSRSKRSSGLSYYFHSALEGAMQNGHLEVVSYMLEQGFKPTGDAVKFAVDARSFQALEMFLKYGWDVNKRWMLHRLSPIWYGFGFLSIHRLCDFVYEMRVENQADNDSRPIIKDDLELVKWFLSHGASGHLENNRQVDRTPLGLAARYASMEIIQLLITEGGAKPEYGNILLDVCRPKRSGRLEVLRFLLQQGARPNELEHSGIPRVFQNLCSRGFPLGTALHATIENNKPAYARLLMEHGADRTIKDTNGRTPFDVAVELGLAEMIRILGDSVT